MPKCDFSGYATKNDLLCSDGRIIKKDAFKDCDGSIVPLVWNHDHNSADNVLGHALLENRANGVYAYCRFNDTEAGQTAKKLVNHGDIRSLSIWANKLKHDGQNVIHGAIREVSLVLAGANPGAFIDSVMAHGEVSEEDMIFCVDDPISLEHSDEDSEGKKEEPKAGEGEPKEDPKPNEGEPKEDPKEGKSEENAGEKPDDIQHSEGEGKMPEKEKTVKDVIDTMNEEQRNVMYAMVADALNSKEGEEKMEHNLFEKNGANADDVLAHSEDILAAIEDGKKHGSMRDSFLEHGITNIDYLFPDARNLTKEPGFINIHPKEWVDVIMNGVHHTPFSRIKMVFADITMDQARAKGYIKGNEKISETFSLLKRVVTPTTVYKKQDLDRDDIVDITDFDVVAWIKGEMRMKLDEELARAYIFGDGRIAGVDSDKINEQNIIPVVKDTAQGLYAMEKTIVPESGQPLAEAIIDGTVKAMDDYEGSGNVVAFVKQGLTSDMILLKDNERRRLYRNLTEVAEAMTINRIVKVPASIVPEGVLAVMLDLSDYNVGADKGGAVNMFDDFDIDFNKQKYLIETRCSGALTVPHSAIILKSADQD